MYARATTVQGPPDSVDRSIKIIQEQVLPLARELAGFKGMISLVNRETGKGITATLWESEGAMKASEQTADTMRDDAVNAIGESQVVSVDRYEVAIDERV